MSLDLSLMIMALNPDKSTPGVMPAIASKIGRPLLSLVGEEFRSRKIMVALVGARLRPC